MGPGLPGWHDLREREQCTSSSLLLPTEQPRYAQREEGVMPYLRVLSSFRDGIRQLAISKGDGAAKEILALCDKLRDSDLVPLGVALDDQEGRSCLGSNRVQLITLFS
jgi:cysteinyl-tRNA synthetase